MEKNNNSKIFSNLRKTLSGGWNNTNSKSYNVDKNLILYKGTDKAEYDKALGRAKESKALHSQWWKVNRELNVQTDINNLTNIQIMYRDADLMDGFPEIGAALDIYAEEICTENEKGDLLNIYSKSPRIKSILEDLFVNRLQIHAILPMIARGLAKYGNNYHFLNISSTEGVVGWRQLPVHEMLRNEGGLNYLTHGLNPNNKEDETTFVLNNTTSNNIPFKTWQVAHFRLLMDSLYLPYGISILLKARRAWRQLALMEDMMLIYRLERSFERRVFKINVGGIDEADVPAYIDDIANNFKRTEIIDPLTGLLDLRKNMLGVDQDWFVPVRNENASNPIETLPGASNLDKIEDLSYIQRKVYTALSIPKPFISFDETSGDGKNLALQDIRFAKKINRMQQSIIFELNKIATIHLFLLGYKDELNNFTITMNNPSTQAEMQKIEEMQRRVTLSRDALSDPGNGVQLWSWTKVQREIFNLNDDEIAQLLNEIRIEKAIGAELEQTQMIIKRTGVFDDVDKLYGDPNAQYGQPEGEDGLGGGSDFGGGGGFGGGGDFDFGDDMGDDLESEFGELPDEEPMENRNPSNKPLLNESVGSKYQKRIMERPSSLYMNLLKTNKANKEKINLINEDKILNDNNKVDEIINRVNKLTND